MRIDDIKREIKKQADPKRAKNSLWFFKTRKGEYGEGDKFLGISNPVAHKVARDFFNDLDFNDLDKLIHGKFHEERLIALLILVLKYSTLVKATADKQAIKNSKNIYDFYLKHTKHINNWDLVDLSAHKIIGAYLNDKDRKILYKLAKSKSLWERRIAIISCFHFIAQRESKDALAIAEILINDKHDLIHKAVGWALREVGKKCGQETEEKFLRKHYKTMPRTMLRYAIEKFDDKKRKFYLNKQNHEIK